MRIARRVLKWVGITLGGLIGLIVVALVVVWFVVGGRLNETYEVRAASIAIPADAPAEARGWPLLIVGLACEECHGVGLGGDFIGDDLLFGRIVASNLTAGAGGIGATYTDADWVRTLRHGVDRAGKPLILMPSTEFTKYSDADLGILIAYLKNLPPVDNELPSTRAGPLARVFTLLEPDLLPARVIDHEAPRPAEPVPGVSVEYGRYLGFVCQICHGQSLSGGAVFDAGPDEPPARNLTPGGPLQAWSEADFIGALRTGVAPGDVQIDDEFMPWKAIGQMSDEELKAIWAWLQSLPPKAFEEA